MSFEFHINGNQTTFFILFVLRSCTFGFADYRSNQASGMFDPIGTVPTKDRVALVLSAPKNIDINECTYRMLFPHEVQAAMAFEPDYIVCGTGKDKVKQLGNAVTPPAMEWLLERGLETFN